MNLVPTCNFRFERRAVSAPAQTIGGGMIRAERLILQQMFWSGNKQLWVDVPTVEAEKEPKP
ncbi:hypothetical protein [Variovorax sp. PAMC 28711]|uniref:hypothetical protein n=1 Tax=Variovorax sp. PAMC 28711 TaxID=1795631 RepID=UPI000B10A605|nr:hypothetical protein [Variovorax sp. PAMC 28711]